MATNYDRIIAALPDAACYSHTKEKLAYVDEDGTIRLGIYGVKREDFAVFAAWVADLAADDDRG